MNYFAFETVSLHALTTYSYTEVLSIDSTICCRYFDMLPSQFVSACTSPCISARMIIIVDLIFNLIK